ncbi:MAG: helix-turn-helix domain-containing protein [Minisyncoccota bacterium]
MDEILIGEKKYVSSKQAAKVTGYAKDYIGQLCREGRVPARLVGRSWYVLEAAIHDHRFGKQGMEEKNTPPAPTPSPAPAFSSTWESPRYESFPVEATPLITSPEVQREHTIVTEAIEPTEAPTIAPHTTGADENEDKSETEGETVNVPIHAIHKELPEELLPYRGYSTKTQQKISVYEEIQTGNRGVIRIIRNFGVLLAVLSALLAVANTGYFDNYIISNGQVSIFIGATSYNK